MIEGLFGRQTPVVPVRGVHLDLKGCPPTAQRLVSLLKVFATARYNAVLVEWEDSFPWTVDPRFRSETAYSSDEVKGFCAEAERLGIQIIPLVQCLGHMETPLSVADYAHLREVPTRSDVLNPLAEGARGLVEKMVQDVLNLTPRPRYFHLGGDEAWSFGTHPATRDYIQRHGKGALYLHHVEPLLDMLLERGIRPILWHDMMLSWDDDALRRLAAKADLMVWGYQERVDQTKQHHRIENFQRLKNCGLKLWGATAYKGGDGHSVDLPDYAARQVNAQGYADVTERFELAGVIATAWSRSSTHRVQTAPIDSALDSLVNVGAILHEGRPPAEGRDPCLALMNEIGERSRFEACYSAMKQLSEARKDGWVRVQYLREQIITSESDPRRRGSEADVQNLNSMRKLVAEAESAGQLVREAFADLIPPIWVERYVQERIAPLREEMQSLAPRVRG